MSDEDEDKGKKITVEHLFKRIGADGETEEFTPPQARDDEEKSTEEKLAEREAQLAALALAEFNKEKEKLLEKIPVEKHQQVENLLEKDPTAIEILKVQYMTDNDLDLDDDAETPPPKGKVKALRKPSKDTVESLYGVLTSNQTTAEQKKIAEKKLDNLWKKALTDRKTARKALRGDE